MKLTDEIRKLEGRKRLHKDRRLKSACHEASHCLIYLQVNQPFIRVTVGDETIETQAHHDAKSESVDISGRVIPDLDYKVYPRTALASAQVCLAGHIFEGIVDPHHGDFYKMLMGSMQDIRQASEWVRCWADCRGEYDINIDEHIDTVLAPPVRKYLINNWATVMRVGEALSQSGSLTYAEVKALVGAA